MSQAVSVNGQGSGGQQALECLSHHFNNLGYCFERDREFLEIPEKRVVI